MLHAFPNMKLKKKMEVKCALLHNGKIFCSIIESIYAIFSLSAV